MSDPVNAVWRCRELPSGAYVIESLDDGVWTDSDFTEYNSHDLARVALQKIISGNVKTFYYDEDGNQVS